MLLLLAPLVSACPDASWVPGVAVGAATSKCMKITEPSTHEGCAAACGPSASLACIQSEADNALADALSFHRWELEPHYLWTGEIQYPFEPVIEFRLRGDFHGPLPYGGQPNWGTCSNGRRTNFSMTKMGFFQPNNWNGAEDCIGRSPLAWGGFFEDMICWEEFHCLCEWHGINGTADGTSVTTSEYTSVIGPALMQRAREATKLQYATLERILLLWGFVGSLPAILLVLLIEGYYIRWRQRAVPSTPEEAALQSTVRIALRRRMRQAGGLLLVGGVLVGLSMPVIKLLETGTWPMLGGATSYPTHPLVFVGFRNYGIFLILLILRPADTLGIRIASVAWVIYVAVQWYYNEARIAGNWTDERPPPVKTIAFILRPIFMVLSLASAVFWQSKRWYLNALPSRIALNWLWVCIRAEYAIITLEQSYSTAFYWEVGPPLRETVGYNNLVLAVVAGVLALFPTPRVRQFIQGLFGGCTSSGSSAATVVNTMVSGDAVEALREAHARLYCIRISSLQRSDMENNQDSGLFAKTEKAAAHDCDAFLSHSWRDDPDLKWSKMLEFKAEFEGHNDGKEPNCWLDKACIDQSGDINASLKALPIFLLSSRYFAVFAGQSYTKRLWCAVEVFTFVRASGKLDSLILKPLHADDVKAFARFDISRADCFLREDKQRLLAIVESSYSSIGQFNAACRKILMSKLSLDEAPSSREVPLAEEGGASERAPKGKASARVAPE